MTLLLVFDNLLAVKKLWGAGYFFPLKTPLLSADFVNFSMDFSTDSGKFTVITRMRVGVKSLPWGQRVHLEQHVALTA